MEGSAEELERALRSDLRAVADRLADEEFSSDLYRALANNRWHRRGAQEGAVALSWSRAGRLVNELRSLQGGTPLELSATGGEGQVSRVVADELGRLGWTAEPLDTSREDPEHRGEPESPPPKGHGERESPIEDARGWEREAHREADAARTESGPAPPRGGAGAGGDRRTRSRKA